MQRSYHKTIKFLPPGGASDSGWSSRRGKTADETEFTAIQIDARGREVAGRTRECGRSADIAHRNARDGT